MPTDIIDVRLRRFDPSRMLENKNSLFIGRRGSGKSVAMKDVLYHVARDIPGGICFSGTEESNHFWGECIPPYYIYSRYRKDRLRELVRAQRRVARQGRDPGKVFVVAEDVLFDESVKRDEVVRQVFLNGRHYGITMLASMQYALDLPPAIRLNTDYVFAFHTPILADQENLYRYYFGMFPTFAVFQQVLRACTENHECLVADLTQQSTSLENTYFFYKARMRGPFRVGCQAYWLHARLNYDPTRYSDDDEEPAARPRRARITRVDS